jgi:ribosomal protein L22
MVDLINAQYPDQEEAARIQRIKFAGRMSVPTIHHIAEKDVNDAWKILNAWKSTRAEKKRARHEHQTNAGDVLK